MENENVENEIWRVIPNFPDYEVSSFGRVKSRHRMLIYKNNRVSFTKDKILKSGDDGAGREFVVLRKGNKSYTRKIHVLVMLSFVGARPTGYDICHIDSNPRNNKLSNLSYDTNVQNKIDVYRTGKRKSDVKKVLEIRQLYKSGKFTQRELANFYEMDQANIGRIVTRKYFSWLNSDGSIKPSKTAIKAAIS